MQAGEGKPLFVLAGMHDLGRCEQMLGRCNTPDPRSRAIHATVCTDDLQSKLNMCKRGARKGVGAGQAQLFIFNLSWAFQRKVRGRL